MKKIFLLFTILILVHIVSAGVSHPTQLFLEPGEKEEFHFVIDAAIFSDDLACDIEFESKTFLDVGFDKESVKVSAGGRVFMSGTVKVPKKTNLGTYLETFCVTCNREDDTLGATTKPRYCDIPIRVNVVGGETEIKVETPSLITGKNVWMMSLITLNVILLVILVNLFFRKKRMKKS